MAQVDTKGSGRAKAAAQKRKAEGLPFTKTNYIIFLAGVAAISFGYIALGMGSITLAPVLLVVGYCVIIPVAILYRGKDNGAGAPQ